LKMPNSIVLPPLGSMGATVAGIEPERQDHLSAGLERDQAIAAGSCS